MSRTILVKSQRGHTHEETWVDTDLFCPNCASLTVWRGDDGGDFYVGQKHVCTACGSTFYLPDGALPSEDPEDIQRVNKLRG